MESALVLRGRPPAPTEAPQPPSTQQGRHVFPFFRLPRELRDDIYDKSLKDRHGMLQRRGGLKYHAAGTAAVNLLLVSKQFNHEYRARALKKQTLHIDDTFTGDIALNFTLPKLVAESCPIIISVIVSPSNYLRELDVHREWLPKLLNELPASDSIQLIIKASRGSSPTRRATLEWFLQELRSGSAITFAAEIHGAERDDAHETGLQEDFKPMMRWSHEKGKLEDIIAEEAKDVEN